jgi:histidinol-phosphatase (PHP family)
VIVDYHMHLRDGREEIAHDTWSVDPFVETAQRVRIDEIGFTEHAYYFTQTRSLWNVPYLLDRCNYDIEPYVEAVVGAKERGLPVKLGLEVDYVRGREEETRSVLARYPWDYLLGSVHFIDGRGVDGEPRLIDAVGVERAWEIYFDELASAARSGLFDSLSHPDLVKIFGDRVPDFDYAPFVDAVAESGLAIEVSTAGFRKPVGELYPGSRLLSGCRQRGIPVTTGSDAHSPDVVGRDFDRARELLQSTGYTTVTVFERRSPRQVPLG